MDSTPVNINGMDYDKIIEILKYITVIKEKNDTIYNIKFMIIVFVILFIIIIFIYFIFYHQNKKNLELNNNFDLNQEVNQYKLSNLMYLH